MKKSDKSPLIVEESSSSDSKTSVKLLEHDGFKVGDTVFFNASLVNTKYHQGRLRDIFVQDGTVVFDVWDTDKGMCRMLPPGSVFLKKPASTRKK
jgi:hypothetical protein